MDIFTFIINLALAFMTSAGFAFYFQAPRRSVWTSALTGMIGWGTNLIIQAIMGPGDGYDLLANFANGVVISVLGEYFGKKQSVPAVVYYTCGVVQPVPGGSAIMMFYALARHQLDLAGEYFASTIMISAVIALGILVGNLIMIPYTGSHLHLRRFKLPSIKKNNSPQ